MSSQSGSGKGYSAAGDPTTSLHYEDGEAAAIHGSASVGHAGTDEAVGDVAWREPGQARAEEEVSAVAGHLASTSVSWTSLTET